MDTTATLEQVEQMAARLSETDRRILVEKLATTVAGVPISRPRRKWSEICGMVPYPYLEEDAQAWVTRTRQEGEDEREKQWRQDL